MAFIPGTPGADTLTGTDQADLIFGRRGNDSISSGQADGDTQFPSISNDGRYVAYHSNASNLVSGDTNNATDVFMVDRLTGSTERLSVGADGSLGNGASGVPSISADGRYITFSSVAPNLVAGDTYNAPDVFVASTVGSRGTAPASGDLEGATISYAYEVTNHHSVQLDGEDLTVGLAVELTNFPGFASYVGYMDFFGNSLIIHFDSDAKFGTGTFNGFTLQDFLQPGSRRHGRHSHGEWRQHLRPRPERHHVRCEPRVRQPVRHGLCGRKRHRDDLLVCALTAGRTGFPAACLTDGAHGPRPASPGHPAGRHRFCFEQPQEEMWQQTLPDILIGRGQELGSNSQEELPMDTTDKSAGRPRKGRKHAARARSPEAVARPDRLAFTVDAKTGAIIQIESIDATGARHELSKDETLRLAKDNGQLRLEALLERAFEAGIACVLGGEDEPDEAKEAQEEAELRHILLKPLIDDSPAARLMRRDVLDRAIVETLIRHSLRSRSDGPAAGPPPEPDQDRAAPRPT